jgi:Mn-containing catalase
MFLSKEKLLNDIAKDKPDPAAAKALQEALGGQFGEMRTMMQYQFQGFNFIGDAKPFRDAIKGVGTEGFDIPKFPERIEAFSPGLDAELLSKIGKIVI